MESNDAINPIISNAIMTLVHGAMTTRPRASYWFGKAATRHAVAVCMLISMLVIFRRQLTSLVDFSLHDDRSSHIIVIPLISALLIVLRRKNIFSGAAYCPAIGAPLLIAGIIVWY